MKTVAAEIPVHRRYHRAFCDCGRKATVFVGTCYICERCAAFEKNYSLRLELHDLEREPGRSAQ